MRRALISALFLLASPLAAQVPNAATKEVQEFVKAYVDVTNRGDLTAYVEMYSHRADLATIVDGEILRGWDAVREQANQMMGTEGGYRISAGTVDVVPLGTTRAIAYFPFVATVQTTDGPIQIRAAITLVLEKEQGTWRIIHDHTSTAANEM